MIAMLILVDIDQLMSSSEMGLIDAYWVSKIKGVVKKRSAKAAW